MTQLLRDAIEHLHEGIQVIGADWRYLYLNTTAAVHGRRPSDELIGRRMQECYPGIEDTAMFAALERVMAGRTPEAMRNRFDYPDGEQRWFELRIEPVPAGICVLSIDVTDDQRTQQRLHAVETQLHQLQRLESVSRLAGGVAHDFNNQLTVILGLTQFMLERDDLDDAVRSDLTEIEAAAQRSGALTKQLLAFSRRQVLRVERLHLPTTIRASTRMLERLLRPNVQLELRLDPATEDVMGDASHLGNVLANLAINASDAMPEGGLLTIASETVDLTDLDALQQRVMRRGRYTLLTVTDTGEGMDADTQARIFDPFFTTKETGKGTGLGLATVYGMVKQMGGFIWVQSAPNRGATFRLYFPIASSETTAATAGRVAPPARASDGAILVIEDDPAVRDFVVRALQSEGYRVASAGSSEEAETVIRHTRDRFALVLCDVVLPGVSGPAFVERSRLSDHASVVFMSGYSAMHVERHQLAGGFTLLQKPFTRQELVRVVRDTVAPAAT